MSTRSNRVSQRRSGDATTQSSHGTRLAIMLAAENLFGEAGVDAVSLRAICAASEQRNISSVQYHFNGKEGLLKAIFEFREREMERLRQALLSEATKSDALNDVGALLRVIFEPYGRMFLDDGNIGFAKLLATYLNHIRPRGHVLHPADYLDESFPHLHEAMLRLRNRLDFLDDSCFRQRVDSVGALFYGALIQYAGRDEASRMNKRALLDDTINMMTVAISIPSLSA